MPKFLPRIGRLRLGLFHNAKQGRTGGVQRIPVIKAGLFCNHYRISPVTGKTSNNCSICLLPSQDFPASPLFYHVWHSVH